jgi:LysM repeat protein
VSPLFAALPPADLPTVAYVPTAVHAGELLATPVLTARSTGSHTVRSGDTVSGIAARYGVSVDSVVRANDLPQGGRWILPGTVLTIPGGSGGAAAAPAPAPSSTSTSGGASSSRGSITVRAGDTLSHLALRHGTTVSALARTNGLSDPRMIYPGQVLRLPGSPAASAPATAGGGASGSSSGSSSSGGSVTVRAGDTLSGIAARHGVTVAALAAANDISSRDFIHPGQRLRLPGGAPSSSASSTPTAPRTSAYDPSNVGDYRAGEDVPDTFLHYRYSDGVARSAAANRDYLASVDVPGQEAMKKIIVSTSKRYGVDHKLMLALSYQESGWNMRAVSPANAIGVMQVIPMSGDWASSLIGRDLNLLDPEDNVEAGVVIMRALLASTSNRDHAIGGYYQGLASVRQYGLFPDTQQYVRNIKHFMTTL